MLCQLVKLRNQIAVIVCALAVLWGCVCALGCDEAGEGLCSGSCDLLRAHMGSQSNRALQWL